MKRKKREARVGIALLLPSAAGVALFYFVPFCISIVYSFSKVSGRFIAAGFANYKNVLDSEAFLAAFKNTFAFLGLGIMLILVLGYLLAALIKTVDGYSHSLAALTVTALLLPLVLPSGSVLLFFRVITGPFGVLNGWLARLDVAPVLWLRSSWAFWVLLLLYLWKNTGYCVVMLLAGLLSVPQDMLEAARIDGAHGIKLFFRFTFIHLLPFFCISAVMGIIAAFKMYRESYMLMGVYPHQSVYMLQNYLLNSFSSLSYQRLSSATVMFTLALGILLFPLLRIGLHSRD